MHPGEVLDSYVGTEGGHFLLHLEMRIEARQERVRALLTDYAHLDRISPRIVRSEVLYENPPQFRIRVTSDGCVAFFCRQLVQVQDVFELKNGYILVRVLPEMSDFKYSENLWHIRPHPAGGTLVTYSADLVPDFWVPPFIGTALFRNRLLEESRQVVEGLERLANLPAGDRRMPAP